MDIETYITERVDDQLTYYKDSATKAKNIHHRMQTTMILLGILIPVVVNLPHNWGDSIDVSGYIQGTVTLMALLLAGLTGISNFRKFGDLWLSYRMTEELIKHEKYLFQTSSGQYTKSETATQRFVQTIESIVSSEHNKFRALIEDAKRPTADIDKVN